MATTHYNFPEISGTDVIDGVNAVNGLANAVDSALYTVDATAGTAATDATAAKASASEAVTAASAASTNAAAAQATASQAVTTANAAKTTADVASESAMVAKYILHFGDGQTVTSGLAISGCTYSFSAKCNAEGDVFEFSGHLYNALNTSGTLTLVAVPGGVGNFAYGVATGISIGDSSTNFQGWYGAGIQYGNQGTSVYNVKHQNIAIGTDGKIYVCCSSSSSQQTLPTAPENTIVFIPSIHTLG